MKGRPWLAWAKRIAMIAIICLITLGAILVADRTWARHSAEEPLLRQVKQMEGVTGATLKKSGTETYLEVEVRNVGDLKVFYEGLERAVTEHYGDGSVGISLVDNRDENLTKALYQAHFHITEAISTGKFGSIPSSMEELCKDTGIDDWQVWVGTNRVYLRLESHNRFLYEVFDRSTSDANRI